MRPNEFFSSTASSVDYQQSSTHRWIPALERSELVGKVCLVTGGTEMIGRATLVALGRRGADVAFSHIDSDPMAEELCQSGLELGVRCQSFQANASSASDVKEMVDKVLDAFGSIDIVVNNPVARRPDRNGARSQSTHGEGLSAYLDRIFNTTQAVLPRMIEAGWGRVINVAAAAAVTRVADRADSATKAGAVAFTMSLARELGRKGITVNMVAPGYIEAEVSDPLPEQVLNYIKAATPIGRLGRPEELAEVVTFLASPRASYITGQVLSVNGGLYIPTDTPVIASRQNGKLDCCFSRSDISELFF